MDLHSPTFEIQLLSCHTFVLITRFRTCVMSRPASPRRNLLEHVSRTQVVSHMHSQSHIITSSDLSTFVNFRGMEDMDPKPKNHMERSTRAISLYRIVILCLSQPRNVRRLPGPPVYTSFWGDGKPPWLGGPKAHSPHDMFIHAGFE